MKHLLPVLLTDEFSFFLRSLKYISYKVKVGSSIFSGMSGAQRWTSAPAFAAAEASPGTDRAGPPVSRLRLATVWKMRISGMVRKDLGESVAEGILAKSFGTVVVKLLAVPRRRGENFVDGSGDFLVAFGVNQGA